MCSHRKSSRMVHSAQKLFLLWPPRALTAATFEMTEIHVTAERMTMMMTMIMIMIMTIKMTMIMIVTKIMVVMTTTMMIMMRMYTYLPLVTNAFLILRQTQ